MITFNEKISVIIPVYNSQNTLNRCIDSIINQTYQNFELILINDGSTDNSINILRNYEKQDSRIKVYDIKNKGVAHARNYGISLTTSDYIKFVDSDDDLTHDCLEKLYYALIENNADVSVCRFNHVCFKQYLPKGVYDLTIPEEKLQYYSDFFASSMPWNKLFKKSVLINNFNENLSLFEDEIFNLSNLNNIKKAVVLDEVLYNYFTAEPTKEETEASLVNCIVKVDFWNDKSGYWYKCNKLQDERQKILNNDLNEYYDNFLYARMFDISFWECIKLISAKLPKEAIIIEMKNIFSEQDFINSIKAKEKFGFTLKSLSNEEFNLNVEKFVNHNINIYNECKRGSNIEPYYEMIKSYAELFLEFNFTNNNKDLLCNLMIEYYQ